MDEYLPSTTYIWCQNQLQQLGFDLTQSTSESTIDHRTIYLQLRTALNDHILSGNEPELGMSRKPIGALNWQPAERETVREMDLGGDGAEDDDFDAIQDGD